MRVHEVARLTGSSVRALRYYESKGLVVPARAANGYRDYDGLAVAKVNEIRALMSLGFSVEQTRPFLNCLDRGHVTAEECPESRAAYRAAVQDLDRLITQLQTRRERMLAVIDEARSVADPPTCPGPVAGLIAAVDTTKSLLTLIGTRLPALTLEATDGRHMRLDSLGSGFVVLFIYPLTGQPGVDVPDGWMTIPGARGCTAEATRFGELHGRLLAQGVTRVLGLSCQSTAYQQELVARLRLPYPVISDEKLSLGRELNLPLLHLAGRTLFQRLTLILADGVIDHIFYPIADPAAHPDEILGHLLARTERDAARDTT